MAKICKTRFAEKTYLGCKGKQIYKKVILLFTDTLYNVQLPGEKLVYAPAWDTCSAGQCEQNRKCCQGYPFHVFFGKGGGIVTTFLLWERQKFVFQNI